VGDPVVEGGSRWRVLWVHHEAEELGVHYGATIPRETARHVVLDLLASGRVPPMQATLPSHGGNPSCSASGGPCGGMTRRAT
jgi:hypothetical protein